MGRRSQAKLPRDDAKTKQGSNLTSGHRKLQPLVDKLLRLTTAPAEQGVAKSLELQREINQVTDQVQALEKDAEWLCPADIRRSAATLQRFANWLRENGAKFDGTSIAPFPGYELGLRADVDIKESSLVLAVPRELMLTVEAARKSALGLLIEKDPLLSNMPNVALALFLLFEKFKRDSFWKPYIDILPITYSTILYFDLDDLKELQASPTLDSTLKQMKNIARQYAYFYKLIWASDSPACKVLRKHFTFNQYRWAVSTVMTRQNTVPSEDGAEVINALMPLWDLCNHTNGNISTDYNPELKRSECLAVKDFKAGEQIFIFYGARSNAELFVHNGFVYEDNIHDGYWLRLGVSKSDPLKEKRLQLLQKLFLSDHGEFWLKKGSKPIDGQLLGFLRIFNMDEGQLGHWLDNNESTNLLDFEYNLEKDFETKCWGFLAARLKLILSTYKTSLEEDSQLVSDTQLPHNKFMAIQMRMTEKKILKDVLAFAEKRSQN